MPETARQYLATTAQRELDALRTELDVRLSALEAALARPDPSQSLEGLIMDLARVATAEAELATARAALEAQLHAQERAAASAEVQRPLEAERATTHALRQELEQMRAALEAERDESEQLRQESDDLQKAFEEEQRAAATARRQVQELETTLRDERSTRASLESELTRQREHVAQLAQAKAALEGDLSTAQRGIEARSGEIEALHMEATAAQEGNRHTLEALQRRYDELEKERASAAARESALTDQRDGLARDLAGHQQQLTAARTENDAQRGSLEELERRHAELERDHGAANDLVAEMAAEREALTKTLDTERQEAAASFHAADEARREAMAAMEALERQHSQLDGEHKAATARAGQLAQDLAAVSSERDGLIKHRDGLTKERDALLEERDSLTTSGTDLAHARDAAITERDGIAHERDDLAKNREALAKERDGLIKGRETLVKERDTLVKERDALVAERDKLEAAWAAERRHAAASDSADEQHRAAITELETRCAALEQDLSAANELASEMANEREALAKRLETDHRHAEQALTGADDAHRAAVEALERRSAELDGQQQAAAAYTTEVENERDSLIAEMQSARETQATLEARAKEAEARATEAAAKIDHLTAQLESAETTIDDMREAVETRLSAIDAERTRTLKARDEAQTRTQEAMRERDAMAADVAALRKGVVPTDHELTARLETATEKIRALELQLFERDRGPKEKDVDVGSMLDATASPPSELAGQRARRHAFPAATNVRIDREGALLVDLSVTGAQVICKTSPEVGRIVTLTLISDEVPCFAQGRLLWARREQTAKGRPYRYRVGLVFTAVDEAEIEAFVKHHSVG